MKILIVYGTRPEFLKVYPLIKELKENSSFEVVTVNTGQHKEMVLELEEFFKFKADNYLDIMTEGQSLNSIVSKIVSTCDELFIKIGPDYVVVQGDTTTVLSVSIAAFNRGVKVCHLEAGLRSHNILSPFPEEFNRRTVSLVADLNLAPTEEAKENLLAEGVAPKTIFVTGNTIIDTLQLVKSKLPDLGEKSKLHILVTAHRRENHGEGIKSICNAIKSIINKYEHIHFIWPVHPNPNVANIVYEELKDIERVELKKPLDYISLLTQMQNAHVIWTDSGGIQEEAPEFNKPVLILRDETERPEIITCGLGFLVGTNQKKIQELMQKLIEDKHYYQSFKTLTNPFGDGLASQRISSILKSHA